MALGGGGDLGSAGYNRIGTGCFIAALLDGSAHLIPKFRNFLENDEPLLPFYELVFFICLARSEAYFLVTTEERAIVNL